MKEVLLSLACGVMLTAGAEGLVLAERGAPPAYTIVVPEKASPSQRYAAEELRDFTEQMTGVKLPIATDAKPLPVKKRQPPKAPNDAAPPMNQRREMLTDMMLNP